MDPKVSAEYGTREQAEEAARQLIERGIPESSIVIEEGSEPVVDGPPAYGTSLGGGVTPDVTEGVIAQHANDPVSMHPEPVYVLTVSVADDPTRAEIVRDVIGE
jgi:hypothetical protein